jgi:hypothetical protein
VGLQGAYVFLCVSKVPLLKFGDEEVMSTRMADTRPTLYTVWGRLNSCAIKSSILPIFINFSGPNLVTCKVMRPDLLEGKV